MSEQILQTNQASTMGLPIPCGTVHKTVQASMDNTVSAAAVVEVLVSNDAVNWILLATLTLSGPNDTDGVANDGAWKFLAARTTATTVVGTVTVLFNSETS